MSSAVQSTRGPSQALCSSSQHWIIPSLLYWIIPSFPVHIRWRVITLVQVRREPCLLVPSAPAHQTHATYKQTTRRLAQCPTQHSTLPTCTMYKCPTRHRRSSQPTSWLCTDTTKPNTTKASNMGIKWHMLQQKTQNSKLKQRHENEN